MLLLSCGSGKDRPAVTDTEVATAFIRNTLDNNIEEAKKYVLNDDQNTQLMDTYSNWYQKQGKAQTEGYRKADIVIDSIKPIVTDSLEIIYYRNSFDPKEKSKLKMVRSNNKWMIDFKYTALGNQ